MVSGLNQVQYFGKYTKCLPRNHSEISESIASNLTVITGIASEWRLPTPHRSCEAIVNAKRLVEGSKGDSQSELDFSDIQQKQLDGAVATFVISMNDYRGILEFSPRDQVVTVKAGTSISELQRELYEHGQALPLAGSFYSGLQPEYKNREAASESWNWFPPTFNDVGTAISLNLPHVLQAQHGSWRDWILGMTIALADGTIVKSGSKVVKSVAGYDLHRFMVGTRETLGVIVDVTLRTFPFQSLQSPEIQRYNGYSWENMPPIFGLELCVHRVQMEQLENATTALEKNLVAVDRASATLWLLDDDNLGQFDFGNGLTWRMNCGERNLVLPQSDETNYMLRAKKIFDPTGKLNPGEMGIF